MITCTLEMKYVGVLLYSCVGEEKCELTGIQDGVMRASSLRSQA